MITQRIRTKSAVCLALLACVAFSKARPVLAGPVDADAIRAASWLVGTFTNATQAESERAALPGAARGNVEIVGRALEDPVVFGDGLYVYLERRRTGESSPFAQTVYRVSRVKGKIRMDAMAIDSRVTGMLAAAPQMLGNLAPSDLARNQGCDIILEPKAGAFLGATLGRDCRTGEHGAVYARVSIEIAAGRLRITEQYFDGKDVLIFGPAGGRADEYHRVTPPGQNND